MQTLAKVTMATRLYRSDLDGLRAVAVLIVLLFHLDIELFSGGYVGVDIFFVISGFLITGIIRDELTAREFSIWRFYERRIRRIFPALFAMLAIVTVVAWLLLMPRDFKDFGQSLAATTLFASNILFLFEAGYFDAPAELKPLLHTWSLAVEEQFYVVFPLLLWAVWRWLNAWLIPILIVLFVLSFAFAVYGTNHYPVTTFFLSPSRSWELLAGALLALNVLPIWPRPIAVAASWLGLACVIAATLMFDSETPFPGYAALLPVAGAVLLIHSGTGSSHRFSANALLSLGPAVFVGLISYSLYLWHWPLVVFTKYYFIRDLTVLDQIMIAAASIAAAYLSWRFVEQPYRRREVAGRRPMLFGQAASAMAIASVIGVILYERQGFPDRFPPAVAAIERDRAHVPFHRHCAAETLARDNVCIRGHEDRTPDFMLLGDSHGISIAPAVFAAAEKVGRAGIQFTVPGYRPFLDYRRARYAAIDEETDAELRRVLARHPNVKTIFVIAHWQRATWVDYVDGVTGEPVQDEVIALGLQALVAAYPERQFIIIRDFPISKYFGANRLAREIAFGRELTSSIPRAGHELMNATYIPYLATVEDHPNATVTHLDDVYCSEHNCYAMENNRSLYRDDNHLSLFGAMKAKPFFIDFLQP